MSVASSSLYISHGQIAIVAFTSKSHIRIDEELLVVDARLVFGTEARFGDHVGHDGETESFLGG
jgi:hypothetical protein